jgi:hypothetical protein
MRSPSGGHGGASRPRSRRTRSFGLLSPESAVEPEPASESVDESDSESTTTQMKSSAAQAQAPEHDDLPPPVQPQPSAPRSSSGSFGSISYSNGCTTRPVRCSPSSACRHQVSAPTRLIALSPESPTSSSTSATTHTTTTVILVVLSAHVLRLVVQYSQLYDSEERTADKARGNRHVPQSSSSSPPSSSSSSSSSSSPPSSSAGTSISG